MTKIKNFWDAISPLLLVSFLGWAVLTILINAINSFFNIYNYIDYAAFAIVVIDVVVAMSTLFLQYQFIQKFQAMSDFFTFHRTMFMKEHNNIADPMALNAFQTNVGRFIEWNSKRLSSLNVPKLKHMQNNHKMMMILLAVLSLIAIIGVKFKILLTNFNDITLQASLIIIDLGLLVIPASFVIWAIAKAQYNQYNSINNWYSNIMNYFNMRSRKYFIDGNKPFDVAEELRAKHEIFNYFEVSSAKELQDSILNFKKAE